MLETLRPGLRLLLLALGLHLAAAAYFNALWPFKAAMVAGSLFAPAYCALYFWFGYRHRLGFGRGLLAGLIGAGPGLLLTALGGAAGALRPPRSAAKPAA